MSKEDHNTHGPDENDDNNDNDDDGIDDDGDPIGGREGWYMFSGMVPRIYGAIYCPPCH